VFDVITQFRLFWGPYQILTCIAFMLFFT
jgi:hypothetical protein